MAVGALRLAREAQAGALARGQREADLRVRHGESLHHLGDRHVLGALGFQELQARRHAREEIAHLDARAGIAGAGFNGALRAAVDGDGEGLGRAFARATEA